MKDFFKNNKYLPVYLLGTAISISSLFRAGQVWLATFIVIVTIVLFTYLYKKLK